MVARQFAPGRAVAVAIVLILTFSTLAFVPPALAQSTSSDVFVVQGSARVYVDNFNSGRDPTPFVAQRNSIRVEIPLYQTGTTELRDIPVRWFFWDPVVEGMQGCQLARIGPRDVGSTVPGNGTAIFDIDIRNLQPGSYKIAVWVLQDGRLLTADDEGAVAAGKVGAQQTTGINCGQSARRMCDPTALPTNPCIRDTDTESTPDAISATTGPENNRLNIEIVKDRFLKLDIDALRWCAGSAAAGECSSAVGTNWDITHQSGPIPDDPTTPDPDEPTSLFTHFEADVRNSGTWQTLSYHGGPCNCSGDGFPYEINVTVTAPNGNVTYLSQKVNTSSDLSGDVHRPHSKNWRMLNVTGEHKVRYQLNVGGLLHSAGQDVENYTAHVRYRDFTARFVNETEGRSPENAYEYTSSFRIRGTVNLLNIGTAGRLNEAPQDLGFIPDVNYSIFIGSNRSAFVKEGKFTPSEPNSTMEVNFDFPASSSSTAANFIRPGNVVVHAVIDWNNHTLELNESNNNISLPLYIRDEIAPVFNNTPKLTKLGDSINEAPASEIFPGDGFNVFINVSDDDANLDVVAQFAPTSAPNATRNFTAQYAGLKTWAVQIPLFHFHDFANASNAGESWTMVARAKDSFNNTANSTPVAFKVKKYLIHTIEPERIVVRNYPNGTTEWGGNTTADQPNWTIKVLPNWTGFLGVASHPFGTPTPNQQFYTANLGLNITTAKKLTFNYNGTRWEAQTTPECSTDPPTTTPPGLPLPGGTACPEGGLSAEFNNTFLIRVGKRADGFGPGLWNYSIRVSDVANYTRIINGTLLINDTPPRVHLVNVSVPRVVPGTSFKVCATFSDDDNDVEEAFVNFTRVSPGDGKWINLTLMNRSERTPEPGQSVFDFNDTIETGRGKVFGLGGTFNVTFHARDGPGHWASLGSGNVTIVDEDAPQLASHGIHPPGAVEIGQNVTFWARPSDSTNVSVRLEVFRAAGGSELLFDAVLLNESSDGNFTYTRNFSGEAVHGWRLTPIDSVDRVGTIAEGTLAIRDNLGPKYELRSPSYKLDGTTYGSGTPRIEVAVFDVEGVLPSSIEMTVGGVAVDHELGPLGGNLNGFLVSYEVRANRKFEHKDVVEVTIRAADNSTERLVTNQTFAFTVDDVAPIARLQRVTPSFRDQPGHILNVSLESRFELAADDSDGLPTGVESIRYRILGGGPGSAETVYAGPFKIDDAPGIYTGPRRYTIQFWAQDAVGNFNRNFNVTEVFVDDTPPALFQFFPQGRSINATFVDDRVGVDRAVVWYRVNNDPYIPFPLTSSEGAWAVTLPEGVKGDRASYYLQAWDRLNNTDTFGNASAPYASFDVSNHEPKVRITSPVEGGRVFRTIDITWDASDEDGDALVFTLYYKAPGKTNFVELAKLENSAARRYTLDTTRFPDGQYTFRIAAGDGGFVKLSETTVTILNRASPVGVVTVLGDGLPGQTMLVKAEITKAQPIVEARLYQGERLVGAYPMNDEGRDGDEVANDGFYSARVPVDAAGDYRVEIFAEYREDGETKQETVRSAATFSAKLTPGYIFSEYAAVIALIGLLAAVGIGVGVFVVMRRR